MGLIGSSAGPSLPPFPSSLHVNIYHACRSPHSFSPIDTRHPVTYTRPVRFIHDTLPPAPPCLNSLCSHPRQSKPSMSSSSALVDGEQSLFPASLISAEVTGALPEGFAIRPLARGDHARGLYECLGRGPGTVRRRVPRPLRRHGPCRRHLLLSCGRARRPHRRYRGAGR